MAVSESDSKNLREIEGTKTPNNLDRVRAELAQDGNNTFRRVQSSLNHAGGVGLPALELVQQQQKNPAPPPERIETAREPYRAYDLRDEYRSVTQRQINEIAREARNGFWGESAADVLRQAQRNGNGDNERTATEVEDLQKRVNWALEKNGSRYRAELVTATNPNSRRNESFLVLRRSQDDPQTIVSDYFEYSQGSSFSPVIPLIPRRKIK